MRYRKPDRQAVRVLLQPENLRKLDLGGGADFYRRLARIETIERFIVMGNDLGEGEGRRVAGRVTIGASSGVNLVVGDNPEYVKQQRVSAGFFRVLGVTPGGGRIIACLSKSSDKLTPACKKVLEAAEKK